MTYDGLSPRQKDAVDLLMEGRLGADYRQGIADKLQVSLSTISGCFRAIWLQYGILPHGKHVAHIRLVYLRAKELGLIQ